MLRAMTQSRSTRWTLDALRGRRDQILALATKRGAHNVRVFGSVARGEASAGSDVDLLVDFEAGRSLLDHGGLIADLQDLLGCDVDVITAKAVHKRLEDRIINEALPL
jgi:predicted nucleotidyltransferase